MSSQTRRAKLKSACNSLIMSTPLGGGHIIFAFSAVRRPSHLFFSGHFKEKYLSYVYQIGMGVY